MLSRAHFLQPLLSCTDVCIMNHASGHKVLLWHSSLYYLCQLHSSVHLCLFLFNFMKKLSLQSQNIFQAVRAHQWRFKGVQSITQNHFCCTEQWCNKYYAKYFCWKLYRFSIIRFRKVSSKWGWEGCRKATLLSRWQQEQRVQLLAKKVLLPRRLTFFFVITKCQHLHVCIWMRENIICKPYLWWR